MHKATDNVGDNKCMNIYEVLRAVGFGNMSTAGTIRDANRGPRAPLAALIPQPHRARSHIISSNTATRANGISHLDYPVLSRESGTLENPMGYPGVFVN